MKKKLIMLLFLSVPCTFPSFAFVMGGSNLYGTYPEYTSYINTYDMSYNDITSMKIEVTTYLENCNNDIQRIQEAKQEAIEKYNAAVRTYNYKQQ